MHLNSNILIVITTKLTKDNKYKKIMNEENREKVKTSNLVVWVAISKSGNVIVFSDEPKLVNDEWEGNLYLNSSIYPQIERLVKHSSMTHTSAPEQIVFTLK